MARILLLEDDDTLREMLDDILTDHGGHYVDCASQGEMALELAREHLYALMISDIRMAKMDGLTTVAHVKVVQQNLPILMITGYEGENDRQRAIEIGVDAYLQKKEINIERLLRIVNSLLRQPEQKSWLATLVQPFWVHIQDKMEQNRQKMLKAAQERLEAERALAYRRLVTAIMSDLILQGPSLDLYDQLTDIDIAYTHSKSDQDTPVFIQRFRSVQQAIAEKVNKNTSAYSARPPEKLSRPAWKRIYEQVKDGLINATELAYVERLRWMKPEERHRNLKWEALHAKAFPDQD